MSDQPEPPGPNPYQPQEPTPPPYGQPQTPPPYGQPQQNPYEQAAQQPPPQQPYAQPPYGQPPYGQPQQPYAQQPPYGYPQPGYSYAAATPNHPSATTSLVLGIIGLAGILTCAGVTLVLSPFAWFIGAKAVREIDANPGTYGGRGSAQAGKVTGIIGTILLILGFLLFALLIVVGLASDSSSTTYGTNA